jgi:tetratricopeptide (TPR) repeat protein/transglutaminase-like putative cysteine protease
MCAVKDARVVIAVAEQRAAAAFTRACKTPYTGLGQSHLGDGMKNLWAAFVVCFLFAATTSAQQQLSPPPQTPATPLPAPMQQLAPDYSTEPFIVEKYETKVRFENDGTGERDLTARIKVQSDAGVQQLGELVFGFNSANEQMDVKYVRVLKPDGTVITAAPDAIKEMTASVERDAPEYTDYKEKHITVPSLHVGDTIEYDILTKTVTSLAPNEFWYSQYFLQDAIILDERLEINVPQDRALIVKSADYSNVDGQKAGGDSAAFSKKDDGGRTIYLWKHSVLTRPTDEELKKKKTKPEAEKQADVQITTFKNWAAVAAWYADLQKGRTTPTPEIRAKAQELANGKTTELDKIAALYNYVAQNIRYVSLSFGLGRFQPHSAANVFKNQYGDCKDKVTLLAAMLNAIDIPSDAVLIPSARKIDPTVPSPSQFDHLITAVPYEQKLIWMDSTAEVAPFRLLVSPLRGKSALLVPPDGAGKLVETPADPPWLSTQRVEMNATVTELGKLNVKLKYFLRGDNEYVLRVAFRRTPQTQWKELGQTIASLDGIKGEVTSVKPSDPSDTANPFELDLEFSQAGFLDWSSKRTKVPIPMLSLGLPDAPADQVDPVKLGSPLDVTERLTMKLPKGFTAEPPFGVTVDRDYAYYKSTYHFSDDTLTAERTLNFKMDELPAARTNEYLTFSRTVDADESQTLEVDNPAPGSPEIPKTATADELLESGIAALNAGNPDAAIPLLKRASEIDPKTKQVWNDLGLAYLRLGQFDDAAAAFHKQIDADPYDEHVYNYLGLTLSQQEKFSEAADAFKKQLEINPLDPVAHAALGGIYLDQHRFAEAVPELDKATVLAPDNAELQVSLGRAYLNSGQKEKAMAAFDKAIDIAQTPVVWNNVAYDLSENGIELDKAQQYAESAVSTTAATLRNVGLAHLTLDDLNQVANIGVYWDTLGWVHFKQGDLDTAEKYVRSSWLLNQHGEVGDHLAQIYEKRGQKEQAIKLYAEAMAAQHSVPETKARLIVLLGTNTTIDALVAKAKPSLMKMREFSLAEGLKQDAKADFYVLLSPGEKRPTVVAAKFIGGSQDLRPFAEKLKTIDFGAAFPDASPAKLVRRGTLTCSAATGKCTFTLMLPEDIHALN